jgi:hypothetical protein
MTSASVGYRYRREMSGILCGAFIASAPGVTHADQDGCRLALTVAAKTPTNIELCDLARTDRGEVLGYLSHDTLYLARKDTVGTRLVEVKLATSVMTEALSDQTLAETPFPAGGWPDAKQFYFPFDVNSRIRDNVGQPATGFVCIDPKSAHLTEKALKAVICKQRPKE